MKKILLASSSVILILFLLIIAIYYGFLQETALVANELTLETKDFNINIQTTKNYWEKSGCQPTGCTKISACNVRSQVVSYIMDCPIEQCYATSYNNCDSVGFQNNCAYGEQCGDTSYSTKYCDKHCSFSEEDVGQSGGVKYTEQKNCAWQVQITDKQGNVIKKFDNIEKYGKEWDKTGYYREEIQYSNNGTNLKYTSDNFGTNWQGTKNQCLAVKFRVEDSKYRYEVCIGNDGIEKDKAVCDQAITKTCKLLCGLYEELDIDNCECKEVSPPEFNTTICNEGDTKVCEQTGKQVCVNNEWGACVIKKPPICIQVMTTAINPLTNECKIFPTPCDVPSDWNKVNECPIIEDPIEKSSLVPIIIFISIIFFVPIVIGLIFVIVRKRK